MMKRPSRILPYILLRVLPTSILILLLIWLGLRFTAQTAIQEEVDGRLASQALYLADSTSRSLETLLESTKGLAGSTIVTSGLSESSDQVSLSAFFESLVLPGPKNVKITMIDQDGLSIASNQDNISYKGASWLAQVAVGESIFDLSNSKLLIIEPIITNDSPQGALVVEYGGQQITEVFATRPEIGAFAVINNSTRNVIYSSNPTLAQIGGPAPSFESARWFHVNENLTKFDNLTVISAEEQEQVFTPVRRLDQFLFFAMGLSIIALVAGVGLSAHLVTSPLSVFIEKLREIRGTEDLQKVTMSGSAEFQEMADSFNQMIEDLQSTTVSRDYVDNIIKSMSDTLIVVGPDNVIQRVNIATCQLLGYKEEELIGKPLSFITPEDQLKKRGQKSKRFDKNIETVYSAKTGRQIPMLFSASAMRDTNNQLVALVCVAQDITDLQQARQLLRQNEEKYRTIFEKSKDAIFINTPSGKFIDVNEAMVELFGYTRDKIMQMNAPTLYLEANKAVNFRLQMQQHGSVRDFEVKVRRKNGSDIDCLITAAVRRNESGKILSYQGIIHNITERKKAERFLEEYNQTLEQEVAQRTAELATANQEITEMSKRLKVENLRLGAELDITRYHTGPAPALSTDYIQQNGARQIDTQENVLALPGIDDVTRQLQQILLPTADEVRQIKGVELAGASSRSFDGDYYDFLLQHGHIQIGIGHVNGRGVKGATLMFMTGSVVRTLLTSDEDEQIDFLKQLNHTIDRKLENDTLNKHNTFSLALLDYHKGGVRSSGQQEELLVIHSGGKVTVVQSNDLGFSINEPIEDPLQVQAVEGIVLYSKLNAQLNSKQKLNINGTDQQSRVFNSVSSLSKLITDHWQKPAEDITNAIVQKLREAEAGEASDSNEFSLLVLKQK